MKGVKMSILYGMKLNREQLFTLTQYTKSRRHQLKVPGIMFRINRSLTLTLVKVWKLMDAGGLQGLKDHLYKLTRKKKKLRAIRKADIVSS